MTQIGYGVGLLLVVPLGALGSALGAWSYAHAGWSLTSCIGLALPLGALYYFFTED